MPTIELHFDAELVDEQSLLNGTRYRSLEGAGDTGEGAWTLTLNYGRPKDTGSSLDEGDLTLFGPDGSLVAGLESGQTDIVMGDLDGDEQEVLDLLFRVTGGEGRFAEAGGEVHLRGELLAGTGRLDLRISLAEADDGTQ